MEKEPKKYWMGLEEYHGTKEFTENAGKEFPIPPPMQEVTEMDRRGFLKVMGAGLLLATSACTRRPVEKVIPYVNKPEEITPGIANWYTSTCQECSAQCGLLVKTREGRPIKLEGNPDHALSQGGLCARGQASILNLYYPGRLKGPVAVGRSGAFNEISWTEADASMATRLAQIKKEGKSVVVLSGVVGSPATKNLVRNFLKSYSGSRHVSYEGVVPEEIAEGQRLSYGQKMIPRYRLDQADVVVSLGADFLGTYLSPVEFSKNFSKRRQVEKDSMLKLVVVESGLSLTGSNADIHIPVSNGDELSIGLALAHEISLVHGRGSVNGEARRVLSNYSIEKVSAQTGVSADVLRSVAKDLIKAGSRALVLGGAVKAKNAVALQVVANLINSSLGSDGVTVDAAVSPSMQADSSFADLLDLADDMQKGKVGALLIVDSNPVYTLPESLDFAESLSKVGLVVSFANSMDETSALADFILPQGHYLERWGDANPQSKVFSLVQPAIRPLYNTRSFQDTLLTWSGSSLSWHEALKNYWQENIYPLRSLASGTRLAGSKPCPALGGRNLGSRACLGVDTLDRFSSGFGSFEGFWDHVLQTGCLDARGPEKERVASSRNFNGGALSVIPSLEVSSDYSLSLYPSIALYDGRSASNAWLQELPDPIAKISWANYVSISPKAADDFKLVEEDVVSLSGVGFDSLELPVHIQPKLNEKTMMLAVGYGRTQVGDAPDFTYARVNMGQVGKDIGTNAYPLQNLSDNFPVWGSLVLNRIVKTGKKALFADSQSQHRLNERDIVKEATFDEYLKNPHAGNTHHEELISLWKPHEYNGYKWGMSVDLTKCTGCSACVIGCQSENNIPVVGPDQIAKGRIMHWLRIDRYYQGELENPEIVYQPMMCQQCDHAPCETVCPVAATVHSPEGLNEMIYNRCVGTRYCSNNCPYKVRRFNFFEFSKEYISPMNLALNPDITTRSRGVMEKCTFCVQRIREAKDSAKDTGRLVADGEIKTACQQSCPTDAIVFGNTNDHESLVAKETHSPRGFHVLEEVNARPQVAYLTKIRNS